MLLLLIYLTERRHMRGACYDFGQTQAALKTYEPPEAAPNGALKCSGH